MPELVTSPLQTPLTLFLVGMQCRSWRSFWKVPLIGRRMGQMQKELLSDPESGLIWGANFVQLKPFTTLFLSYWKSSDHIYRFLSDRRFSHLSSAAEYFQKFGNDPNLGVWHETYEIDPGKTENLYFGMTGFGAAAFSTRIKIDSSNKDFLARLRR